MFEFTNADGPARNIQRQFIAVIAVSGIAVFAELNDDGVAHTHNECVCVRGAGQFEQSTVQSGSQLDAIRVSGVEGFSTEREKDIVHTLVIAAPEFEPGFVLSAVFRKHLEELMDQFEFQPTRHHLPRFRRDAPPGTVVKCQPRVLPRRDNRIAQLCVHDWIRQFAVAVQERRVDLTTQNLKSFFAPDLKPTDA